MIKKSNGILVNIILLLGGVVLLATGISFLYSPIYRYLSLGTSLDLLRDAYSIAGGTILVFLPFVSIHKKYAFRFLFSMSLIFSIVGIIACTFFWLNTAGKGFEVGDKSGSIRFIYLAIFTFFLGFSLLAIRWKVGKNIMMVSVLALTLYFTIQYFLDALYIKMILGFYGFFILAIMYRNLESLLSIFASMIMPYFVLDFIQYGRVTWFFGVDNSPKNFGFVILTIFSPENYITLKDDMYTFYLMVGVDILISLIIGYIVIRALIFIGFHDEIWYQKLAEKVFPIVHRKSN